MCGILVSSGLHRSFHHRLLKSLRRRGPDEIGFWSDERVQMAHARLSIIGLDERGTEPMENDTHVLIYNGEIYNFNAIADRLRADGVPVPASNDAEVLLHAWSRWGASVLTELHGFWSFVVYDKQRGTLTLARDQFGIKPLYYWKSGDAVCIASMIRTIIDCVPQAQALDYEALSEYCRYQFTFGDKTFLKDVRKVEPGHTVEIDLTTGRVTARCYEDILAGQPDRRDISPAWIDSSAKPAGWALFFVAGSPHPNPRSCAMKTKSAVVLALLLLALPGVAAAQHSGGGSAPPSTNAPAEARQFDFLIGQWELDVKPKVSSLAAMIQVFALNMTFDIGLKLISFHLIVLAVFLLAPDASRFSDFFLRNRPTGASVQPQLFMTEKANRLALILQLVFGLYLVGMYAYINVRFWEVGGGGKPLSPLYGVWNVEELAIDGQVRAPDLNDYDRRWRRVIFDAPSAVTFQRTDDSFARFGVTVDSQSRTLALTKGNSKTWKASFSFERPSLDQLVLEGEMDGHKIRTQLRLLDSDTFRLLNSTFRWVRPHDQN